MRGAFDNAIADGLDGHVRAPCRATVPGPTHGRHVPRVDHRRRTDREQPTRPADEFRRRRRRGCGRADARGARRLRRHRVHGGDAHARDRRPCRARRVARRVLRDVLGDALRLVVPGHRRSVCCSLSRGCASPIPPGIRSVASSRSSTRSPPRPPSSWPCSRASRRPVGRPPCSRWSPCASTDRVQCAAWPSSPSSRRPPSASFVALRRGRTSSSPSSSGASR